MDLLKKGTGTQSRSPIKFGCAFLLGSGTKHGSSSLRYKTTCRTSHDFQTMREEIRERLGVRMGHTHVAKRGNDSHEHPVQDEA